MDNKVALSIIQHLNHPNIVNTITDYVDDRIHMLHVTLEGTKDADTIRQLQGAIIELRRLSKIREHALAVAERERNG